MLRLVFPVAIALVPGCGIGNGTTLPNESTEPLPMPDYELVARFAHICDTQIIDEQSPARLAFARTSSVSSMA